MASNGGNVIDHNEALVNNDKGGGIYSEKVLSEVLNTVCLIKTSTQCGTGFIGHLPLDGKDTVVLVTVNHVINKMDTALESDFTFQYCEEGQGVVVKGADLLAGCDRVHKACPPVMFDGSLGLDYFIAKINTDYLDSLTDGAGKPLGIKPIDLTDTVDVSEGHVVSVIQHPKGQPRSISYFTVTRVIGSLLFYQCDTEGGSSGSPVFKVVDNVLKIVAVHRGERSAKEGFSGVNIGSRVSSILNHIKTKDLGHMPTPQDVKLLEELKLKKPFTRTDIQDRDKLFQELWRFLQKIESKWIKFADQLGIDKRKIDNIKADGFSGADNEVSCREMLSKWMESTLRAERKWSTIKKAAKELKLNNLVKLLEETGVNDDDEPEMKDLQTLVIPEITDYWYDFGMKLKVRTNKLNTIKINYDGGGGNKECMRSVVDHWLRSTPGASWDHVISALKEMEEIRLAEEITDYMSHHVN